MGEFNNWEPRDGQDWATKNDFGTWELFLPDAADGTSAIPHRSAIPAHAATAKARKYWCAYLDLVAVLDWTASAEVIPLHKHRHVFLILLAKNAPRHSLCRYVQVIYWSHGDSMEGKDVLHLKIRSRFGLQLLQEQGQGPSGDSLR